jgi:predicted DNA-binding transcriptional regulator AlpA
MSNASPVPAGPSPLADTYHPDTHYERQLGMAKGYFRILRQRRAGPGFIRIGRSVRYGEQAVSAWLATQQQERGHA